MSLTSKAIIPVSDPGAQYLEFRAQIEVAIKRVLDSGYYILGPEVVAFESEFAEYIGTQFAIGVANGTDALALALRALGIGQGDEVITVSHTAVATVSAIEQAGATPVLIDVESGFLTLDPSLLEQALTDRTRAVVPVHIYGQAADIIRTQNFCKKHGLALVEDVSQAHGARYNGQRLGSFGDIAIFSCYPTKNLGALGDAGIVVTDDRATADRVRRLRQYGWEDRNLSIEQGVNSRLDEMQAAILRVKLPYLDAGNRRRREISQSYSEAFRGSKIEVPRVRRNSEHVFHLYVAEVLDRDGFRERLAAAGVQSAVHYSLPVHCQPAYADRVKIATSMSVTNQATSRIVSLPVFPELSKADCDLVVRTVLEACS
jgi:dTDP-4-amino-4,6-dideoxygalactose transaminase